MVVVWGCERLGDMEGWRVWLVREVGVVEGAACACGGGGDVSMGMWPL